MPPDATTATPLNLERSLRDPRTLLSTCLSVATALLTVLACVPLFSTLIMLIWRGGAALGWRLFVELPPTAFEDGGGFGNAIVGTLVMVGIAACLSVPCGILAAVFLAEFRPESRTGRGALLCQNPDWSAVYSGGCVCLCRRGAGHRDVLRPRQAGWPWRSSCCPRCY